MSYLLHYMSSSGLYSNTIIVFIREKNNKKKKKKKKLPLFDTA